jgi:hypothetical protein
VNPPPDSRLDETYVSISDAIRRSAFSDVFSSEFPEWYGLVVAEIAVLATGEEIELVDAVVDGSLDTHRAHLVLFTTNGLVITVDGSRADGYEDHTTRARSRSGLVSLGVSAATGAFGAGAGDFDDDASGALRLELAYDDGWHLQVPAAGFVHGPDVNRVRALAESLRTDLVRGRRA